MKKIQPLSILPFLLVAALALLATPGLAGEADDGETRMKVLVAHGDGAPEILHLEEGELEIGESRQIYTDSGKEVVVTRSEGGFEISVDGESVASPSIQSHDESFTVIASQGTAAVGDSGEKVLHRVIVEGEKAEGDGIYTVTAGGGQRMIFVSTDGETTKIDTNGHGHHWVSEDAARPSAARHLEESGALDELDAAARQRILDELEAYDSTSRTHRVVVVEARDEEDGTF